MSLGKAVIHRNRTVSSAGDGIGAKVTMAWPVLGPLCASWLSRSPRAAGSKAASRHRPIAIDPEGLAVRDHAFGVNIQALTG
jgi:hypothetical protein